MRHRRPAARQRTKMHKVQSFSAANRFEVTFRSSDCVAELRIGLWVKDCESGQRLQAKYGIVEIAFASAVLETSIFIHLTIQKSASKLCGIAEDFAREPSHLKHFQTKAHRCL